MPAALLDRQLLERLERLTIRWHKSFRGLVGGHNSSRYAGPGQEFLDHRRFHQGDDLRAVNWRAYMRLERLFLKMFQVEPRTPIRLLLDSSESMSLGSPSKFDYARRLAAALVYVGLVRHDSLMIQPFHERPEESMVASGGRHRFGRVNDFLAAVEPRGRASLDEIARLFINAYPKPGLLILVSDFLDDGDALRPLQHLADFGHELLLVHVWSPEDRHPSLDGELTLEDAESESILEITLDAEACTRYTKAFDRHAGAIENLAFRSGGRYAGFETSVPLDEAVFQALNTAGAELERAGRAC